MCVKSGRRENLEGHKSQHLAVDAKAKSRDLVTVEA
jgi:hypothetical protein